MYNIGSLTKDTLEMYFEHSKSKGDTVKNVRMFPSEGYAIVTFEKYGGTSQDYFYVSFFSKTLLCVVVITVIFLLLQ